MIVLLSAPNSDVWVFSDFDLLAYLSESSRLPMHDGAPSPIIKLQLPYLESLREG